MYHEWSDGKHVLNIKRWRLHQHVQSSSIAHFRFIYLVELLRVCMKSIHNRLQRPLFDKIVVGWVALKRSRTNNLQHIVVCNGLLGQ